MKQYIIRALYSIIFSVIFSHLNGMELEVQDSTFESLFKNHVKYKEYESAIVTMSKTARNDGDFRHIQKLVRAMHDNQEIKEIIKNFNNKKEILLRREDQREYGRWHSQLKEMKDEKVFSLFLFHGVKIPNDPEFIREIVANASVASLKLLELRNVKFNDPELFKIALKTEELARINFVLDQQENNDRLSEFYSDILKLIPKNCNLDIPKKLDLGEDKVEIAREVYMHLLNGRNGNIKPLEDFIIRFDNDMQQLQSVQTVFDKIRKNIKGSCYTSLTDVKKAVDVVNDNIFKYPKFIDNLIKKNNKFNNKGSRKIDKAFNAYEDYADDLIRINLGTGCAAWYIFQGFVANPYLAAGGALGLIWQTKKQYAHFKKRREKYYKAQKKVDVYKNSNYLEGYLCGRQNQSGQEIEDWHEKKCEENVYKGDKLDKAIRLSALAAGFGIPMMFLSGIQLAPSDRDALDFGVGFLLAFPMCFSMLCKIIFKITESRSMYIPNNNSADLFRCVYERGKREGYLHRNRNQFQPELQRQEQISPEQPSNLKTLFGSVATWSKNLFGGFVSCISKYTIRNPGPNLGN